MADAAQAAVAARTRDLDFLRLAVEPFARAPKKSIDYAVMERTTRAAVVYADLGWTDLGSWSAVWDVLDHDAAGNATTGPVTVLDSRNILVHSDDAVLTTVIGIDDIVVVTTVDAVLVVARDKAEDVKTLVERLKVENRREAIEHRRIYRPWGYYQGIDIGGRYQVKRIVVKPARSSLSRNTCTALSTGSWLRVPPRSPSTTMCASSTRTNRFISRSAASTALPIPARSPSNSSRCRSAAI
jgi:mannose-1-phosphate guanylyltransferase/mannose-6-phosphate isomerase